MQLVGWIGTWVTRIPWPWLALASLALVALKATLFFDPSPVLNLWLPVTHALPQAIEYYSASFGLPIMAKILGVSNVHQWFLMSLLTAMTCFALAFSIAARRFSDAPARRAGAVIFVAFLPLSAVALNAIERSDALIVLAASLVAFGRSWPSALAAAALLVAANPEQGLVTTACLAILTFSQSFKGLRGRAWLVFAATATGFILVQIWMLASGVVSNRIAVNLMLLEGSLASQASQWPWLLFAVAGALWVPLVLVAGWIAERDRWRGRLYVMLGTLGLPLLVTFITLDGVRVLAAVSAVPVLAVLGTWLASETWSESRSADDVLGAVVLGGILTPPVTDHWPEVSQRILGPLFDQLSEVLAPLREWALQRFPRGNL